MKGLFNSSSGRFEDEIKIAIRLAREAGRLIMALYGTGVAVRQKGESGPVTEADERAHEVIVEGLQRAFPHDAIISEEGSPVIGSHAGARTWYVDPLDGTQEFIARNGEFSVLIGLAIAGRATVGVVLRPVDGALFAGIADQEAWSEDRGMPGRLAVSRQTELQKLRLVVSRSHRHPLTDAMRARLGITEELRCGSVGLKIGMLVSGQADLYLDASGNTSAWDVCGPEAILRGAGGRLTDLTGQPVLYESRRDLHNKRGLIASNGVCHDQVVAAIGSLAGETNRN
jgi:3'(2'), 5'-bisphosphate nucleotidase